MNKNTNKIKDLDIDLDIDLDNIYTFLDLFFDSMSDQEKIYWIEVLKELDTEFNNIEE